MNRILAGLAAGLALAACAGGGPQAARTADVAPAAAPALQLPNLGHPQADVYTSGRIGEPEVAQLEAAGVRHVVDLTAPAETPAFDEAAALQKVGIAYDNLPIAGAGALTRDNVAAFDALLRDAGRPLLVHCASSNRVGAMAALRAAWIDGKPVEAAIAEGRAWGMTSLEGAVRERLEAGP